MAKTLPACSAHCSGRGRNWTPNRCCSRATADKRCEQVRSRSQPGRRGNLLEEVTWRQPAQVRGFQWPRSPPARPPALAAYGPIKNNARRKKSRLFFYEATFFLFICKNSPMGSFPRDPGQPELRATRDILARWDVCLLGGAHDSRRRLPSMRGLRSRMSVMSKPQKLNVQLTSPLILASH